MGGIFLALLILSNALVAAADADRLRVGTCRQYPGSVPTSAVQQISSLKSQQSDSAQSPAHAANTYNCPVQIVINPEPSKTDEDTGQQCTFETVLNSPGQQPLQFEIDSSRPATLAKCEITASVPRSALLSHAPSLDTITLSISLQLLITNKDVERTAATTSAPVKEDGSTSPPSTSGLTDEDLSDDDLLSNSVPNSGPLSETVSSVPNSGPLSETVSEPRPSVSEASASHATKSDNFFSRTAARILRRRQKREMEQKQQQIEFENLQEKERMRRQRFYRRAILDQGTTVVPQANASQCSSPKTPGHPPKPGKRSSESPVSPLRNLLPASCFSKEPKQAVSGSDSKHAKKTAAGNGQSGAATEHHSELDRTHQKSRPGIFKRQRSRMMDALRDVFGGSSPTQQPRAVWHQPGPASRRDLLKRIADVADSDDEDDIADSDECEGEVRRRIWALYSDPAQMNIAAGGSTAASEFDPEELSQIDQLLARSRPSMDPGWLRYQDNTV